MYLASILSALLVLASSSATPNAPTSDCSVRGHTTLVNALLIDGTGSAPLPGYTIEIAEDRIVAIYPDGARSTPVGSEVIDLQGMTLMPGLINAHIHLQSSDDAVAGLKDMLSRGITSVRDLGGDVRPLQAIQARAAAGEFSIPAIYYSAVFAGPEFSTDPRVAASSSGYALGMAPWQRSVGPQSDLPALVSEAKATGAQGLKIYASIDRDLLVQIVAEAKVQGMQTWVHSVVFPANATDVVSALPTQVIHTKGLVSADAQDIPDNFAQGTRQFMAVQPFAELDPSRPPYSTLFSEMQAAGIILEPALIADGDVKLQRGERLPPPILAMRDWACRAAGAAYSAGVEIGAGTDFAGNGDLLLLELKRLHECGIPRLAVLRSATLVNARALGIADTVGSIEVGKRADIIMVNGNPAEDLEVLRTPIWVMQAGRFVSQ